MFFEGVTYVLIDPYKEVDLYAYRTPVVTGYSILGNPIHLDIVANNIQFVPATPNIFLPLTNTPLEEQTEVFRIYLAPGGTINDWRIEILIAGDYRFNMKTYFIHGAAGANDAAFNAYCYLFVSGVVTETEFATGLKTDESRTRVHLDEEVTFAAGDYLAIRLGAPDAGSGVWLNPELKITKL